MLLVKAFKLMYMDLADYTVEKMRFLLTAHKPTSINLFTKAAYQRSSIQLLQGQFGHNLKHK